MGIFTYDTYQDVRHNLFKYSVPFIIIAGFFCYFRILPPDHQQIVSGFLQLILESQPWKDVFGGALGITFFTVIAFLIIELIQIHDRCYDKYIIKWRVYYDLDFIIPRLVQPYSSNLNYRFYEEAASHLDNFQEQLYYPFVGDRDLKISKNKLVRFYETVTRYWLTQINEIVIIALFFIIVIYRIWGPVDLMYRTILLNNTILLIGVFIINRYFARKSLGPVREATTEEIKDIHEKPELLAELGERLKKLCSDYKIPYSEPAKN
jgi:hypothetical protein